MTSTAANPSIEELFGPVIYAYTRAQALKDGELIDVTPLAREAGIGKFPVAVTRGLDAICTPPKTSHESRDGRLWDVLWLLSFQIRVLARQGKQADRIAYQVKIGRRLVNVVARCGPGDDAEPVITVMLPEDD